MNELLQIEETQLLKIKNILRRLGVYRNYKGYSRLVYAVYLVCENESRLQAVVKEIYMPVAEKHHCSWFAVERCLRETIFRIWATNYNELCIVADSKLIKPPIPSELLDILAMHIATI